MHILHRKGKPFFFILKRENERVKCRGTLWEEAFLSKLNILVVTSAGMMSL